MESIGVLVGLALLVLTIVLPIAAIVAATRAKSRCAELYERILHLESHLRRLERDQKAPLPATVRKADSPATGIAHVPPVASPPPMPEPSPTPTSTPPVEKLPPSIKPPPIVASAPRPTTPAPEPVAPKAEFNWEQFLGVKLFAWLAGLAALFGAIFGLKYSVEHGWVPPAVRAAGGFVIGAGLVAGGLYSIRRRFDATGQALCATGIVILYAVTFACKVLYRFDFFSGGPTFAVMVLITIAAFLLAVRIPSQTVAILGFAGGFLTPILVSSGVDNPPALFGYIALLDIGLLAVALHRRWHYLAILAAVGTAGMQIGWAERFFSVPKLPTAVAICLLFVAVFTAAVAVGRRIGQRRDLLAWAAFIPAALAMAFSCYFISLATAAAKPGWIFATVFVADLSILAIALMNPAVARAHAFAGAAAFFITAIWIGVAATTDLLPWALGFIVLLGAIHVAFPFVLGRARPDHTEGGWISAFPALGLAALLVPVISMDDVGLWLWPAFLLLDLIAIAAAAASGALLAVVGAVVLTLIALGAAIIRLPEAPLPGHMEHAELYLIAAFAVFFCTASAWLLRRSQRSFRAADMAPPAWERLLPGLSAATPFALLVMLIFKLGPTNPLEIFGVALLLVLLLMGLTSILRQGALALAAFVGCLIVEHVWFGHCFFRGEQGVGLACFAGFAALFLAFPFAMRHRLLDLQPPWATAALSLPMHFILLHRGIGAVWPNDIPGIIAVACAVPPLIGLIALMRWIPADAPFRLNRLAWFAGVALFFVTLAFPLQYERHWITIAWALEGAALLWLFHRLPHPGLRVTAIALLIAVFVRLTVNSAIFDYAPRGERPILNWILYTYGVAAAACLVGARFLAPPRDRALGINARVLVATMGTILVFVLMNLEIADYFAPPGSALCLSFGDNLPRDMSYTIGWSLFALALLVIGIAKGLRAARYAAIALLGIALLKLFVHDLDNLDQLYRVGAFIAVAIIAFAASFLYQRFLRKEHRDPT
ncbi:MAG TPA: DUF2339 domain-containing protein [Verrucomicrobiae bacterium]|nr:DUF2339 domain-containing protein [Verrucomicrobiae bacterium]